MGKREEDENEDEESRNEPFTTKLHGTHLVGRRIRPNSHSLLCCVILLFSLPLLCFTISLASILLFLSIYIYYFMFNLNWLINSCKCT